MALGSILSGDCFVAGAYPELPATRNYQLRLVNGLPVQSVTVNGVSVPYNRYGKIAASGKAPPSNQVTRLLVKCMYECVHNAGLLFYRDCQLGASPGDVYVYMYAHNVFLLLYHQC